MTTTPDPIAAIERAPTWLHETEIARLASSFQAGQHPAWVRVEQDGIGVHGGFYTCAAATENSPAYIRADIVLALARQSAEKDERIAALEAGIARIGDRASGGTVHYTMSLDQAMQRTLFLEKDIRDIARTLIQGEKP